MPGRKYSVGSGYRYGFNGKELDTEDPIQYDYGFRIYDPRLARFKSVDPLTYSYPYYTPYQFAGNMPIAAIDLDGLEQYVVTYYKNNNGDPYKVVIRTIKSGNVRLDQNVQKITKINANVDNETDGLKIAKNNVLVFEVYNEGTKRESMEVVGHRKNLTSLEKDIYQRKNKKDLSGNANFLYNSSENQQYQSQNLEGTYYIATSEKIKPVIKIINDVPSMLVSNTEENGQLLPNEGDYLGKLTENLSVTKGNVVTEINVNLNIKVPIIESEGTSTENMLSYTQRAKAKIESQMKKIVQNLTGINGDKIKVTANISNGKNKEANTIISIK